MEIRRAQDREARACRILMPEVFGPSYAPDLWVAIDRRTGLIAGAGAVAWRPAVDIPGFPLHVHVPAPFRRRRIAARLVDAIAEACRGGTAGLHNWFPVTPDSPAAAFLAASNFAVARRIFDFEGGPGFYPSIKSIHTKLERMGKLPSRFSIVSLRDAPAQEIAALVAEHFRGAPLTTLSHVARGTGNHDPDRSVVLLDAGKVRGALLYSWNDGDPVIDAWIVAPEIRRSAAGLMMVEAAARKGLDASAQRVRFSCGDDVHDTIKLAQRGGAALVATRLRFFRSLSA